MREVTSQPRRFGLLDLILGGKPLPRTEVSAHRREVAGSPHKALVKARSRARNRVARQQRRVNRLRAR